MDESAVHAGLPPPELKTRLEQLDVTLDELHRVRKRLEDTEQRFSRITQQCGGLLNALVRLDQQHTASVEALNARLAGLVDESSRRIESFERGVSNEWSVLRDLYEAPLDELKRHAEELRTACVALTRAAPAAGREDRAYQALAANTDTTVTAPVLPPPGGAWALDEVARVHRAVRDLDGKTEEPSETAAPSETAGSDFQVGGQQPGSPSGLVSADRRPRGLLESGGIDDARQHDAGRASGGPRRFALWVLVIALVGVAGALAMYTSRLLERLGELEVRASAADQRLNLAERQVETAQKAAGQQVDSLQRATMRAERLAAILAAPDLQRFDLIGLPRSNGAYAQVLWSRSRGLMTSASRLPPPRPGRVYQVWVLNDNLPVSAGIMELDEAGRGSLMIGEPLMFPRRLGMVVTAEPEGGSSSPTGLVYLRERQ